MQMKTTKVFDRLIGGALSKRFSVLQGGTSSSKTFSIIQYLICIALKSKSSLIISIVSESMPHLKRGAMRDFFNILGDTYSELYHNKTDCIYKIGNSIIEFFSADNVGKVRGPRRHILYINEVNNIARDIVDQLEIRTSYKCFYDFNPTSEFWVHEDLISSPDCFFDVSTYLDNKYLSKNIIKSIESRKFNKDGTISDWYKIYGQGQIGTLEGLIYPYFEQVDELPDKECVYGLDFGYVNDVSALVKTVQTSQDLYIDERLYSTGLTNQDLCAKFAQIGVRKNLDLIYGDNAEMKSIEEIHRQGYFIKPCVKGKGSINIGIDFIKRYNIKVTKTSLNLIKELRNYKWAKDKDGKATNVPEDNWNHALDGTRYAMTAKIQNHKVTFAKVRF